MLVYKHRTPPYTSGWSSTRAGGETSGFLLFLDSRDVFGLESEAVEYYRFDDRHGPVLARSPDRYFRTKERIASMATERSIQLTADGRTRLEEELRQLRDTKLPELTSRMQESAETGDNDDGSETEPLKEEFVHIEARIRDLEMTIEQAEIIPEGSPDGVIGLGSHVTVRSDDGDEKWVLVGPEEADAPEGRLSSESPVGKALMGHKAGDSTIVTTPGGEIAYAVIEVK